MKQLKDFIARRNINKLRYADDTILMADSEEEQKSLSIQVKDENEKAGLKLSVKKTKIMASGPILARRGKSGNSDRCFFLGSKIVVDGDCSHQIRRGLLLGRKAMTNLVSVLKQRYHFADKSPSMVFPVVMYG